jgi:hypothetical protein
VRRRCLYHLYQIVSSARPTDGDGDLRRPISTPAAYDLPADRLDLTDY